MIFTWEPEDIKPGRYYYRGDKAPQCADLGYLASVTHKIGYDANGVDGKKYLSISMTDGCVYATHTKEEFAEILNKGNYVPLRTDRLLEIIASMSRQNEGV